MRFLILAAIAFAPLSVLAAQARVYEYAEFASYEEHWQKGKSYVGGYLDTARGREFYCREGEGDSTRVADYDKLHKICSVKMQSEFSIPLPQRRTDPVAFDPLYLWILGRVGWEVYNVEQTRIDLGNGLSSGHLYYLRRATR